MTIMIAPLMKSRFKPVEMYVVTATTFLFSYSSATYLMIASSIPILPIELKNITTLSSAHSPYSSAPRKYKYTGYATILTSMPIPAVAEPERMFRLSCD